MIRSALLIACMIGLSACSGREDPARTARFTSLETEFGPRVAVRPTALVALPGGFGRVAGLVDRGPFDQTIRLAGAPRGDRHGNVIAIVPGGGGKGRPTQAGIRAEIDAAFPGIPMRVVTRPAANAYGRYGLAVGRTAQGGRCLYAWQWIDDAGVAEGFAGPLALRVRLCREDGDLDALAAGIDGLRLVAPGRGIAAPGVADASRPAGRPRRLRPSVRPTVRAEASHPAPREPAQAPGRFLADAVPAAARPATPGRPSVELPPEAYRGPTSIAARQGQAR